MRLYPQVGKSYFWQKKIGQQWKDVVVDATFIVTGVDKCRGTVEFVQSGHSTTLGERLAAWTDDYCVRHVSFCDDEYTFRMIEA